MSDFNTTVRLAGASAPPLAVSAPLEADRIDPGAAYAQRCIAAIAAEAPLPWQADESDTDTDRSIVIRDADSGYVCEIDLHEFATASNSGRGQARQLAEIVLAGVNTPPPTATALVDALIAGDGRPLGDGRSELGKAAITGGLMTADALALIALDGPLFRDRVAAALYDLVRLARALRIDLDAAFATEAAKRADQRRRLDDHAARAQAAADRARTS